MRKHLELSVIARGLVTALGPDARTCCAAARAGLNRAETLDYFTVRDLDGTPIGLAAHPAALFTAGFQGQARLLRMMVGAIRDLLLNLTFTSLSSPTCIYATVTDPTRIQTGIELMSEDDKDAVLEQAVVPGDDEDMRSLIRHAAELAGWQVPFDIRHINRSGHTGFSEALSVAAQDLALGHARTAVVLAVDSLLDEDTLIWLDRLARLKKPGLPDGLQPGEAAVCVAFTAPQRSHELAAVRSGSWASEPRSLLSGQTSAGEALASTIKEIAADAEGPEWVVTDHNGESYRAAEWGYTQVRVSAHRARFSHADVWYPAVSFGDTGAASAAVALCMVVSAFERNYAPKSNAVILSTSDGDRRSALHVSAPGKS